MQIEIIYSTLNVKQNIHSTENPIGYIQCTKTDATLYRGCTPDEGHQNTLHRLICYDVLYVLRAQ